MRNYKPCRVCGNFHTNPASSSICSGCGLTEYLKNLELKQEIQKAEEAYEVDPCVVSLQIQLDAANNKIAELEKELLNSKESVKRNAYRIIERDDKIAELEKERDEANCHAYYILDTCTVFSPKKLQAHNLEQQAKGLTVALGFGLHASKLEKIILKIDELRNQAKALKEQGE